MTSIFKMKKLEVSKRLAVVMATTVTLYKTAETKVDKKWAHKSLIKMCRELEEYVLEPAVSQKALEVAAEHGINDLHTRNYARRPASSVGLIFEHAMPAKDIMDELISLDLADLDITGDLSKVIAICNKIAIVWVTKEEDKLLPRTGRGCNWEESYFKAGIIPA